MTHIRYSFLFFLSASFYLCYNNLFSGKRKASTQHRWNILNSTMYINVADDSAAKISKVDENSCSKMRISVRIWNFKKRDQLLSTNFSSVSSIHVKEYLLWECLFVAFPYFLKLPRLVCSTLFLFPLN